MILAFWLIVCDVLIWLIFSTAQFNLFSAVLVSAPCLLPYEALRTNYKQ